MPGKKGLSFDEKRDKMLAIFHSSEEVFNFKEIEKLSLKAGISFPTIKEVLESLRADDLVLSDKIGSGNYFWAFPSIAINSLKTKIDQKHSRLSDLLRQQENLKKSLEQSSKGREQTAEYKKLASELKEAEDLNRGIEARITIYRERDPEALKEKELSSRQLERKVNFWTDNSCQLIKHIKQLSPGISLEEIEQAYEIAEWDYLE